MVAEISAQNARLDGHTPTYGIGDGIDKDFFEIVGSNQLNMTSAGAKSSYTVNVTASGAGVFENGNNWHMLEIMVTDQTTATPVITITGSANIQLRVGDTYMEQGATCRDDVDADKPATVGGDTVDTSTPGQYTVTYDCTDSSNNDAPQVSRTVSLTTGAFITTWKTTTADESITLPISGSGMTVNWGDGNTATASGPVSHTYNTAGDHTIQITGELTRFHLNRAADASKLVSLDQWGTASWTTMENAFRGASNMAYNAVDSPDLSSVTDMSYMFHDAASFNGDLSSWNVSSVTDMSGMFFFASSFNQPLNGWNVSSVTDMSHMFRLASSFNQPLNDWDVSSVTDMSYMFRGATSFNQPLNGWNVSSVTDMSHMFSFASSFDQNLNNWNVSSVTDMSYMFRSAAAFNQPLNDWDVSSATSMYSMFRSATSFDQPLNDWNVSSVTDMSYMFRGATSFNQPLNDWNVLSVTDISYMFNDATSFDQPLNDWGVSSVTYMGGMFWGASAFNGNISDWNVSSVTDMRNMFNGATSFNQPLNDWDVSSATRMSAMFSGATSFNQNLGTWYIVPAGTSPDVTTTISTQNPYLSGQNPTYGMGSGGASELFEITGSTLAFKATPSAGTHKANVTASGSAVFENGNNWRILVIEVTGEEFDAFITTWETTANSRSISIPVEVHTSGTLTIDWGDGSTPESVTANGTETHTYAASGEYHVSMTGDLSRINLGASGSTPAKLLLINQWGDIEWSTMENAFKSAANMEYRATDAPDLSGVTSMSSMFSRATSFNGDISDWNVSSVTDMSGMFQSAIFRGATSFDQPLNDWNVSSVTDMSYMFRGATSFNQPLNDWNVLSVTDISYMFSDATSFDQPLNDWGVSSVTYMGGMFWGASAFNGNISDWNVSSVTDMRNMFVGATSFNQPLNDWDVSSATRTSSMFSGATTFDQDISSWNVSSVTDMSAMFWGATSFDQPLNDWNVSSVTDMRNMFLGATSFDQPLNDWGVSSVIVMSGMFWGATSFDQPLNDWGVSSASLMHNMLNGATSFNQPLNDWDVSSVTDMRNMFLGATSFDQPLNDWNVSSVTSMTSMFDGATAFDQNLGKWYVVPVVMDIARMDVPGVVGSISTQNSWLVDHHAPMYGIGTGGDSNRFEIVNGNQINMTSVEAKSAYKVNVTASGTNVFEDGNNWRTLDITVSGSGNAAPTVNAGTDQTVGEGGIVTLSGSATDPDAGDSVESYTWSAPSGSGITFADDSSASTTFTAPAVTTDTTFTLTLTASDGTDSGTDQVDVTVKDTSGAFITTWETTSANESITIPGTGTYTVDWGDGNTGPNVNGTQTHTYVTAGNHTVSISGGLERFHLSDGGTTNDDKLRSIEQWGGTEWTTMEEAFRGASSMVYNATDAPDLSGVTDMSYMFYSASSFNGDLSGWNVSSVTDMSGMFFFATFFNQPLNDWDVSSVTDMSHMFRSATFFNQPLNDWDVSSVTDMNRMFRFASSFNQPLNDWNVSSVTDMSAMFHSASSFNSFNSDLSNWNVSSVTDMRNMFASATSFDRPLNDWDVSSVTDMSAMFHGASSFDRPLNDWDVSSVTDMNFMFVSAASFNQNLNDWDVSSVTDMRTMFIRATAFNGTLSNWNVSSVTDMSHMFESAPFFNQPLNSWNVSSVTKMNHMFNGASSFNKPLNTWNVSSVTDMSSMFSSATAFNQTLNDWNVSSVTSMTSMFDGATSFNQPLNDWDVSSATRMSAMFSGATSFNQNLGTWYIMPATANFDADGASLDVTTVSAQNSPLRNHSPVYGIGSGGDSELFEITGSTLAFKATPSAGTHKANVTASGNAVFENGNNWRMLDVTVTGTSSLPAGTFVTTWKTTTADESITLPISGSGMTVNWGDGNTTTASGPVSHTYNTAGDHAIQITGELTRFHLNRAADASKLVSLDQWGTASWTTMENAFRGASNMAYNAVDSPDLSSVTDMSNMFFRASAFNGDLSNWNVSSVTDMSYMFIAATSFNGDLSSWNVSSVTDMSYMFNDATSFNGDLSSWDVSSVTDMNGMFSRATSFNGDLSSWDVSSVTDTTSMFEGITSFNGDLSSWNVSSVKIMIGMFRGATSFNGDLSSWNVSSVTDMTYMFREATSFNGDLSSWNVSSVTDMDSMFREATSFNGNLSSWNVSSVTDTALMFFRASAFNGDLSSWNVSSVTDMSDMFREATSFNQNLGTWYIMPATANFDADGGSLDVTTVSAQNSPLRNHSPVYGIGSGGDSNLFEITGRTLAFKSAPDAGTYSANVTASGPNVFENGNNWHMLEIMVTGSANNPPTVLAGSDLTVAEGDTLALSGSATDTNGDAITSYTWSAMPAGITFANASSASTTFTAPDVTSETTFTLTLTASDGTDDGTDTVDVTVKDISGAFITIWRTTTANESIVIPVGGASGTYDVIWGDGTVSTGVTGDQTHPYAVPGDHTVTISGGFERIHLDNHADASKLRSIDQWGAIRWTSMESAFDGASAMTYGATDTPDLSRVTDIKDMFRGATAFDGDLSNWNVSSVTHMDGMFRDTSFDGDLSSWNVSSVTHMDDMFRGATAFDGDLSNWNVSSVTSMAAMFNGATSFNQSLSSWNVSSVKSMSQMFRDTSFDGDLSSWDVSSVTDMSDMFREATSFNGRHLRLGRLGCEGHARHVRWRRLVPPEPRELVRRP